jgi:DHA3 family macrolide efflux protein-like MFS transporter
MTPSAAPTLSFGEVLRISAIKRLFIAQIVSVFGDFLALFAVIAHVTFNLHGTPTQIAMIMVSFLLPLALVSPLAGVFVDKWNVKMTMVGSDIIRGLLIFSLVFVHSLNAIYVIFFILATVSAFFMPAQSVAVRTITPMAGLLAVNGLMSQAFQGSQILAPSLSGGLVQLVGVNACYMFDTASFFFSACMLMTIPIHREKAPHTEAASVLKSMRTGFHFMFTHSTISFVVISMAAGMFAVRGFGALLSVYVRDLLHSTSAAFGILNTLIGVGMITGTQSITRLGKNIPRQKLVVYGLSLMGFAVLLSAAFTTMATTAAGMLIMGFGAAFIMITSQTLLQQETPKEMLGRVTSSLMSLMACSQALSMFLAGPLAERIGIRNLYFGSAAMLLGIGLAGRAKLRARVVAET